MRDGREFELVRLEHVDGRRQLARRAAPQVDELLLQRREQAPCLVVGIRREHVDADHRVRLRPRGRRPVLRAIDLERAHQVVRCEVRRECERQPEHRGELGTEQTRAQQPHRNVEPRAGHRAHALAGHRLREIALQFGDVVRKRVGAADQVAAQRARRGLVGAGRAAEAEVDAPRIQRGQRAELLGDHERRVVRQHDAARADADRLRRARDMTDHDGGGRARDARHVVMLGQPVAPVAPAFRVPGEIDGVAERLGRVGAGRNGGEIEYGKRCHRVAFEWGSAVMRVRNKCQGFCQRVPERAGDAPIPMRLTGAQGRIPRLLQKSIQSLINYQSLRRLDVNPHRHTNLHETFDFQDCNTPANCLR
ncbi:hypothetical protein [Burkholderia sp. Bp8992]|uniref:hypothetical protein n=1 Tax=Burkholderia sp. Bp8992 TaxID=2184554 RepID=UPI0016239D98|nr:hypothetical protein [Burkholderia sp. Bp8992]